MTETRRKKPMPLSAKCGIVTGAAQGIGAAIATELLAQGACVLAVDVQPLGPPVADHVGRYATLQADLSSEDAVTGMIATCLEVFGRYDFLVQNAAVQIEKPIIDTTNDDWDRLMTVNLRSLFWGCKHSFEPMARGRGGSIVNMASVLSFVADPLLAAYTIAKHGVVGLTRAVGTDRQFASTGIRCNCIAPGDVGTAMVERYIAAAGSAGDGPVDDLRRHYPAGRIGRPGEVAAVAAFLVSDASSLINASVITADGGLTSQCYS